MKRFPVLLLLMLNFAGCASDRASNDHATTDQVVSVCDAATNAAENYGRTVEVEGTYQQTPHGGIIFSKACQVFAALRSAESFDWQGPGAATVLSLTKGNDARPVHVVIKGKFEKAGSGE